MRVRLFAARVRITVADLPYQVAHLAKVIPGVVRRRAPTALEAPPDVGLLLTAALEAHGVAHAVEWIGATGAPADLVWPSPWSPQARDLLIDAIDQTPQLHSWLVGRAEGPWSLHDYQLSAIWWALERGGGLWKQAPGAGKTVQAAVFLGLLPRGIKICVTKSTVVNQLTRWFRRFFRGPVLNLEAPSKGPSRKVEGPKRWNESKGQWETVREVVPVSERLAAYFQAARDAGTDPVLVVGWDSLRIHLADLQGVADLAGLPWSGVVYDESHYGAAVKRFEWGRAEDESLIAVPLDNRSAAAWQLATMIPHRLTMTATPIPDRRINLWGQLSLVQPGRNSPDDRIPGGWELASGRFARRYCGAVPGLHGGITATGETHTQELQHRLSVVMHLVDKQTSHADLPPVTIETIFVAQAEQDKPAPGFRTEQRKLAKLAAAGDASARGLLAELHLQEAATRKRSATLDLIEGYVTGHDGGLSLETGRGKVLVFTGRHRDCHELHARAEKRFRGVAIKGSIEVLTERIPDSKGTMRTRKMFALPSQAARSDLQEWYMSHSGPCALVATGQAWGTGLDLQDTDLLILNMLPVSPGDFDQWLGRVQRQGQTRPVRIVILIAVGTYDEAVLAILANKVPDIARVVHEDTLAGLRDVLLGFEDLEGALSSLAEDLQARHDHLASRDEDTGWGDVDAWA